jgi:TolA-binding protein
MRRYLKYVIPVILITVLLLSTSCSLLNIGKAPPAPTEAVAKSPTMSERVAQLEAQVNDLNLTIAGLNTQILDLQNQYDLLKNISDGVLTK